MTAPVASMEPSAFRRWMWLEHHARHRNVWSSAYLLWIAGLLALAWYCAQRPSWLLPWGGLAIAELIALFMAPFAMFWRHDARQWQRLALPQAAMFDVTLVQHARRSAWLFAPLFVAVAMQRQGLGYLAVVVAAYAWVVGAAAAAVFAGGLLVANDRFETLAGAMVGEFRPPRVVWLGALPALVGGITMVGFIVASGRVLSQPLLFAASAITVLLAALLVLFARRAAMTQFSRVLAEVVALDRQSLAHVEIAPLSPIETLWCKLLRGVHAPLLRTTFLVLRRRYPLRGMWLAMGIAAVAMAPALGWNRWITSAIGFVVLASLDLARTAGGDVQLPRLLSALGIVGQARVARAAATALHLLLFCVAAAALIVSVGP